MMHQRSACVLLLLVSAVLVHHDNKMNINFKIYPAVLKWFIKCAVCVSPPVVRVTESAYWTVPRRI